MEKLVSVIIPTYARPVNLRRAIDSVLNQSYKNIEVIVVDDNGEGSTEQRNTENILVDYITSNRILYLTHPRNMNGSAARNTGLRHSHGEYIAFLDDDDAYYPNFVSESVKALEAAPQDIGATYCNSDWISKDGSRQSKINSQSGNIISSVLMRKCVCSTSTILFKKAVCERLGGFDTRFRRHQDWEFLIRFFRHYKIRLISQPLLTKYCTETPGSNLVNAKKMYQIKSLFFDTYKNDIDAMPEHNDIYSLHWKEIAFMLARQGYWRQAFSTFRRADSYKKLGINDYVIFIRKIILSAVRHKRLN